MPTIERRIEALESLLPPEAERRTIWIRFVEPGGLDQPAQRIWRDTQEWHRQDGEPDDAFRARAESGAARPAGHRWLLMQMD